ncbi:hypothetical protein QBC39DRAFT_425195 [Podospora conica]|nr:hypothetical protein QBC39DRAFT_425195 [Schizothecium conicum]
MATRKDRLLERMRGARMHEVADISFGFELPAEVLEEADEHIAPTPAAAAAAAAEPSPAAPSTARPASNISAKRTPSSANSAPTPTQATRITRSAASASPQQPASLPRSEVYDIGSDSSVDDSPALAAGRARKRKASSLRNTTLVAEQNEEEAEEPSTAKKGPSVSPAQSAGSSARKSQRRQTGSGPGPSPLGLGGSLQAEEVDESPADAPGSGRRRPLRVGAGTPVIGSSTLLQRVLNDLDDTAEQAASSSPLQRVAARRRSSEARLSAEGTSAARSRASTRLSGGSGTGEGNQEDELTPDRPQRRAELSQKARFKPNREKRASLEPTSAQGKQKEAAVEEPEEPEEPEESEQAQEIDDEEAARRLAPKKRPRRSLEAPPSADEAEEPEPAPKRRRRKEAASPAQQQQPKAKPPKKPTAKAKKGKKSAQGDAENDDEGSVPIPEDEPLADILNAEIPFGNRGGVNAVDVLSKLCEELIEAFLARLQSNVENAEDAAARREQKTMFTSLQAFQEVLRTRLLEHTIALDTLHALRKRVRVAQKEKVTLRDEIMRIRAERDQVALRMDAIRIKHEAESKEALRHISLSSAMHDIDLAIEKGQAAEELSASEQKAADLANLELLISRVADQASSKSDSGGTLKQIKEFNAFLERAATALERR